MKSGRVLRTFGGIALASLFGVPAVAQAAATLKTLATFNGTDGQEPQAGLAIDSAGDLYGTTTAGGADGDGTVFELAAGSTALSTLATFSGSNGSAPDGTLLLDASGNLFGTTSSGGAGGYGTVFKVPAGTSSLSTIATFNYSNGFRPAAGVIADSSGNLYGTTSNGGTGGTVFKIAKSTSTLSTLATFTGTNGSDPLGSVSFDSGGNLYGTTQTGGSSGYGIVFKIASGTGALSTVATFNKTNGANPYAGVTLDSSGDLFGTTNSGGTYNDGTVFEIVAGTNTIQTIASFDDLATGESPYAGVLLDAKGDLFGTTAGGGAYGDGTVFEIAVGSSTITTLATFNTTTGAAPEAGLVADANGDLFGTTYGGSSPSTVFEVTGSGFAVPEPTGLLLLGISSITLLRRRSF